MKTKCLLLLAILAGVCARAQTTAFTFQGQIYNAGAPANGNYDFEFSLFDAATNGNSVGLPQTNGDVTVSNGLFTATIDFGAGAFNGPPRWLQVGVRTNGDLGPYTQLFPLDLITAAPYAITANSASNLLGTVSVTNLTGSLSASQLPSGVVTNGQTGLTLNGGFTGTFAGDGSGLASLNASSLVGAVSPSALTSVPAASLTGTITLAQLPGAIVTNTETNVTLSGIFSGNGGGLTNLSATNLTGAISSALVPFALTNAQTGVTLGGTFSGAFSGDGTGLTGVSASQFAGTVALSQLPSAVITNQETFVSLNGNFSGTFTGNGGGLNSINAGAISGTLPPSVLGSIPASSLTGTIPSSALSGTYGNALTLSNPNNIIAGTILNSLASSQTNVVGNLEVTNFALFTNAEIIITNNAGPGIVETSAGVTNGGNLRIGGWLVGPTTNAGGFWITNGALFVTNATLNTGVILGGNTGNIFFSGAISGNGSGLTDAGGNPIGTSVSNLALTIGANATNFTLTASNGVETALQSAGTAITNLAFLSGLAGTNFIQAASNSLELGLLSAGTTISNYAQSGNAILSNFVSAGGTLPIGATLSNAVLAGPATNFGNLLVTNGTLNVSNSMGSVVLNNGNITFSGTLTGSGTGLSGISVQSPTSGNYNSGYDTTSQVVGGAGTFQTITLNNPINVNSGWGYAAGTFTASTAGLYYVSYTGEAETPNGLGGSATFKVLQNSTALTASLVTTTFNGEGVIPVSQSFMVSMAVNDTLKFQFTGDSSDVRLASVNSAPSFTVNIIKLQ